MADDDEFRYSGLVEWQPGQSVEDFTQDITWEAQGPHRPVWYRDPRVLVGLIVAALAVLVVASVVLLVSGRLGEPTDSTEMTLRPTIRTSSIVLPPSASPETATSTTTSATSTTSATEETSSPPADADPPVGADPPESDAEPAAPSAGRATPEGPRTNVTRNPMSFTPGQRVGG